MKNSRQKSRKTKAPYVPTAEDTNLRKLLFEAAKNPEFFDRLRGTIYRMVKKFPADQWSGKPEWDDDGLQEIFNEVQEKLFKGKLIRFWISARTDSCRLKANLKNLVFNIIRKNAPKSGKLFHSHTANQLKNDPEFVKKPWGQQGNRPAIIRIGLKKWPHKNLTPHNYEKLLELWRQNIRLPKFVSAHKIKTPERADIFRQMLGIAEGWVEDRDFYNGYRAIIGFTFTVIDRVNRMTAHLAENNEISAGQAFDLIIKHPEKSSANTRERARLAIVEGYDDWLPQIRKAINESIEIKNFLQFYFLKTDRKMGIAAEKVNKSPCWATKTLKTFAESLITSISAQREIEEHEQLALVQLVYNELASDFAGDNQP